ncbi:unnamed protein product [Heligmosomoides polygyrus]|uniref:C2 domain-containing protein n=1 Tax=Heligmosomoides polygyrus TaxID=6339 RepID=A0A3P8D7P4_HELPZ|nr:unnamed protein product [Heligmosomoides polygyrus]
MDPAFSALISIPSVKLSHNIYGDVKTHPKDGSPSLSETKIATIFQGGSPIFSYTAQRFVKSYPKELDLNTGLFNSNGNCGYVLKPELLLKGLDPRSVIKPKVRLGIGIISAQYLPKSAPGKDIVDPYVTVQLFGAPKDELKWKTTVVRDNGFNPVWNQSFDKVLFCPEIAMLRFSVKDYDSSTSNDFIGEFSIPVSSVRQGSFL